MPPKIKAFTVIMNNGDIYEESPKNFAGRMFSHAELLRFFNLDPNEVYDTGWIFADGTESWRYIDR